jgi:AcrR family transcriptional regulator
VNDDMDPRVARTHDAVMQAARELLVEGGPDALTVDGVVARSGVAKSTVYRHWATRDDLVVDVLAACAPAIVAPPRDIGFEDALRRLVAQLVEAMADEAWKSVLPSLMILKTEVGGLADLNHQVFEEQTAVVADVLRQGVEVGELVADVVDDVDRAVTFLVGPVLMAGLTGTVALDDSLVDDVVRQFVGAHRPAGAGGRR